MIDDTIRFYRANERPFGCFSSLYRRPMEFEGRVFASAEHAYQAGKCLHSETRDWMLAAPKPHLLAIVAHGLYAWDIVPNWPEIRRLRMQAIVMAKFRQHADLAEVLLSTGDRRIAESASTKNAVNCRWGEVWVADKKDETKGKWVGENWLGCCLMEARSAIRAARKAKDSAETSASSVKFFPWLTPELVRETLGGKDDDPPP